MGRGYAKGTAWHGIAWHLAWSLPRRWTRRKMTQVSTLRASDAAHWTWAGLAGSLDLG